uniref:Glycine receptor, alpha 1 n=1 Tax=Petromyzon marinus TaxID=7757 RepID=S4RH83_PETMA
AAASPLYPFVSLCPGSLGSNRDVAAVPAGNLAPFDSLGTLGTTTAYERRIRPNFTGPPVVVNASIVIKRFGPVTETSMDYQISIFLQLRWNDPQIQQLLANAMLKEDSIDLGNNYYDLLWKPVLFFENEKSANNTNQCATSFKLQLIKLNQYIAQYVLVTMLLECAMILRDYPMDLQHCHMNMESYGYTTNDVILQWNSTDPVIFNVSTATTTFTVSEKGILGNCSKTYDSGPYSCISVEFDLSRDIGYNLIQLYIPSMLLVIISWLSFWIDMSAAPARASLGITTILTITTQSSAANSQLPKVSYIKAIDVWMGMCQVFVFAALLEFAAVNVMARQGKHAVKLVGENSSPKEKVSEWDFAWLGGVAMVWIKDHVSTYQICNCTLSCSSSLFRVQVGAEDKKKMYVRCAHRIDYFSRIIFPIAFFILNIFYWVFYKVVLKFKFHHQ